MIAFLASLQTETLYLTSERSVLHDFLVAHNLPVDTAADHQNAFYALASRRGMDIARTGLKNGDQRTTERGLGIAAVFAQSRLNAIEDPKTGKLNPIGLSSAHTTAEEYRELSRFSLGQG